MGNWPFVEPLFGGALLRPILLSLGPGELLMDGPKYVDNYSTVLLAIVLNLVISLKLYVLY